MIIKAFWDCFYWSNRSFQINAETWTAERVKAVKNKQVKVKAGCFLFSVSSNKKKKPPAWRYYLFCSEKRWSPIISNNWLIHKVSWKTEKGPEWKQTVWSVEKFHFTRKHLLNYQWICRSDEWNDDTNLWGLFSLRFCGNDGTCMYRRPWGGHWLQVWDTKHCTFRMSFPYIHIPASTYTYRTYSYLCLYTYTHTWNHSVKSHGAEFEWSHTKMSESLKPGLQQPHECLLRTALVQTLLPAAPRVLFVLFSARLLFFLRPHHFGACQRECECTANSEFL